MGSGKAKDAEMAFKDEIKRGKRLLVALLLLFILVPLVFGALLFPGILLLEFLWGGVEAVERILVNWTEPSPHMSSIWYVICFAFVALLSVGTPVLIWHRFTERYLDEHTRQQFNAGILPVVGWYLKPVSYIGYVALLAWISSSAWAEDQIILSVFFGLGAVWYTYSGLKEALLWWRRRSTE